MTKTQTSSCKKGNPILLEGLELSLMETQLLSGLKLGLQDSISLDLAAFDPVWLYSSTCVSRRWPLVSLPPAASSLVSHSSRKCLIPSKWDILGEAVSGWVKLVHVTISEPITIAVPKRYSECCARLLRWEEGTYAMGMSAPRGNQRAVIRRTLEQWW